MSEILKKIMEIFSLQKMGFQFYGHGGVALF